MSTEQPKKEITVKIDTSPREERLKADYEQKLAEKDETIKAMLAERKKDYAIPENSTAPLNESYVESKPKIEIEGSDIDPSWLSADNPAQLIDMVNLLAKKAGNAEDFKKIQSKLLKKMIDARIDMTYVGKAVDLFKAPLPIREMDSSELKERIKAYNNKLKDNRCMWRINNKGEDD